MTSGSSIFAVLVLLAALAGGFAGAVALGWVRERFGTTVLNTLRSRCVRITDDNGTNRISMGVFSGIASVKLADEKGNDRVSILVGRQNNQIVLDDAHGQARALVTFDNGDSVAIGVLDRRGNYVWMRGFDQGAKLERG
ncbi:MAG: hypothetical protein AMXMBFR83_25270 [Phycisphaerae bacterium]